MWDDDNVLGESAQEEGVKRVEAGESTHLKASPALRLVLTGKVSLQGTGTSGEAGAGTWTAAEEVMTQGGGPEVGRAPWGPGKARGQLAPLRGGRQVRSRKS